MAPSGFLFRGSKVEVRRDGPGFFGSWYEGTVLDSVVPTGREPRYKVSFSHIAGAGCFPASHIRPRPPPPPIPKKSSPPSSRRFLLDDIVEAFDHGGWWSGIVTAVAAASVTVAFPVTREVLCYRPGLVRPRRDYNVNGGEWVPSRIVVTAAPEHPVRAYEVGEKVEVVRKHKQYGCDSWFPATVAKGVDPHSYVVEYVHGDKATTEYLCWKYMRPAAVELSPLDSELRFEPGAAVEAYSDGSWSPGVVVCRRVVADGEGDYEVALDCGRRKEQPHRLVVKSEFLKTRYHWDGNHWVKLAANQKRQRKFASRKRTRSRVEVPFSSDEEEHDPEYCGTKKSRKEQQQQEIILVEGHKRNSVSEMDIPLYAQCKSPAINRFLSSCSLLSGHSTNPKTNLPDYVGNQLKGNGRFCRKVSTSKRRFSVPPNESAQNIGEKAPNQDIQSDMVHSVPEFCSTNYSSDNMQNQYMGTKQFTSMENRELGAQVMCYKRVKKIADKSVKETRKGVATSEEPINTENDKEKEVPLDATSSGTHPEINTATCIDSTQLKNLKGSLESSVLEIIPNEIPAGIVDRHQENYMGAQKCATECTFMFDNPGDADALHSDSPTQSGNNATKTDKCATSMEQDISEESFEQYLVRSDGNNDDFLPPVKSCQAISHDHHHCEDNVAAMMECKTSSVVATESVSLMPLVMTNYVVPNQLQSHVTSDTGKEDHLGDTGLLGNMAAIHQPNTDSLFSAIPSPSLTADIINTESPNKNFAAEDQQGVSLEDHDSPVIEYVAESSQSIGLSALTQLFSTFLRNSAEAEHGNRLTSPEDTEGTLSKCVANGTDDSYTALLHGSLVHESTMTDRPSASLPIESEPFLKILPFWEHIKKLPQRPHFRPFKKLSAELRESMAIGLILFFGKTAENIRSLNIHDDNERFNEEMKGLCLLEEHGFDVRHLRSRLETLLHIKNSACELWDTIKKLEENIILKEIDGQQRDAQIDMLSTTIRQLECQANIFRSILKSSVSQQKADALEISRLKTEACRLEQSYLSVEQQFSDRQASSSLDKQAPKRSTSGSNTKVLTYKKLARKKGSKQLCGPHSSLDVDRNFQQGGKENEIGNMKTHTQQDLDRSLEDTYQELLPLVPPGFESTYNREGIDIRGNLLDEELCTDHAATQVAKSNQLMVEAPIQPQNNGSSLSRSFSQVPFVKRSPAWSVIEAMDVFKEVPQRPHFFPLRDYSLALREGVALGLMVSFATLVESIKEASIEDSMELFEDKIRSLCHLEGNGFNVQLLQSRLSKLLQIKSNCSKYLGEINKLRTEMAGKATSLSRMDTLLDQKDEVIGELEQRLGQLRQEAQQIAKDIEHEDAELSRLKSNHSRFEEAYDESVQQFRSILDDMSQKRLS